MNYYVLNVTAAINTMNSITQIIRKKIMIKIYTLLFQSFLIIFPITLMGKTTYSSVDSNKIPFDHRLVEIMNYENGVFIEVGAHDGETQSNTKLLEEFYGWTGILIEPSPSLFPILCKNRPYSKCFQCALGTMKEDGTFAYGDFDGSAMSSFTDRTGKPKTHKVLIRSLQSILDECGIDHINFFSLDTEGYELHILKGIDFEKTTFDYLLIEIYKNQYNDIVEFLSNVGYEKVCCFSNYSLATNHGWDGTHNDYLFKRKNL